MSQVRRVVVTGMGAITPVGNDLQTLWSNLTGGVSGIGPITHFDAAAYDCRFAGEVRGFEPVKYFKTPKDVRRSDRFAQPRRGVARDEDAGLPDRRAIRELGSDRKRHWRTEDDGDQHTDPGAGRPRCS